MLLEGFFIFKFYKLYQHSFSELAKYNELFAFTS